QIRLTDESASGGQGGEDKAAEGEPRQRRGEGAKSDYELICEIELRALQKGIFKDRAYWLKSFPESEHFREIARFEDEFLKLESVRDFAEWVKRVMWHFGLLHFPDSADERVRRDRESAKRILLLLEEMRRKRGIEPSLRSSRLSVSSPLVRQSAAESVPPKARLAKRGRTNLADCWRTGEDEGGGLSNSFTPPSLPSPASGEARRRRPTGGEGDMQSLPRNDIAVLFAREFLALMEVDLYSMHSRDKNKVQIYNVSLARQKEYKVVFLAGLLEKQFPIQIKEDPILSDAERRVLNERGEILKERLPRQAFERYLFYLAVTRAREHLILSYPRFNLEGKEALPSFYVEEVGAVFEDGIPVRRQFITEVLPSWDDIATREEAEELVVKTIWSIPLTPSLSPEGRGEAAAGEPRQGRGEGRAPEAHMAFALYNYLVQRDDFRSFLARLLKPVQGVITDERIKPHFLPGKGMWSATFLEEYAECPYRFFSNRVLQLESQAEGIDIKRRGVILHDVLEDFFRWIEDRKKKVSFDEAVEHATRRFHELWQEEPLTGDRYYKLELERKRMQEMIVQIIKMELVEKKPPIAGLRPRYFEYEFRDLVLEGKRRQMNFRGKIDRIDVDPHERFALVIDYKTGKPFKLDSLENGTSLQLPIYLIAVRKKLGLKPLGGHLYSLSRAASAGFHHKENLKEAGVSTRKRNHFSEKEFDEILKRSVQFAERFTEEIERTEIPVRPRDCVSYCPYSSLCRIEKWRLEHLYREIEKEDREAIYQK
ncbi:MAG: PD-(D/E)XK nuclease family protein, partial [Candidatus Omnitrophica bacterium]|nr:PD-(D/E)XK nuclease family protein [Candidatus Omnitrophota bacterium]